MSEAYDPDNMLDRRTARATLELEYAHLARREQELLARHLPSGTGEVLSVGCGWHPGRHLFPAPGYRMTAVDIDGDRVRSVVESGAADAGVVAAAGALPFEPRSFDVVLYRLVLHHIAYDGELEPVFAEAARLLRPGGTLVAVEPGLWHPVGAALALANRLGAGTRVHGTPDDVPLSPRRLRSLARAAGLAPELYGLTYSWRRLAPPLQRALWHLDRLGEQRRTGMLAHTVMLLARRTS
ncbi:MAG: hypothetical protein NVSMB51_08970 [Solirubrobacteraceae bacterium]